MNSSRSRALRCLEGFPISSEKTDRQSAILVAETSPLQQKFARHMLESFQISRVTFARDGHELLDMCDKQAYDLILLDYHLAKNDPLAAIAQLRAEGENTRTPIILTYEKPPGERMENVIRPLLAAGAAGSLAKPVDGEAFRVLAESLLGTTLVSQSEKIKLAEQSLLAARKAAELARSLHQNGRTAPADLAYLDSILEIFLGLAEFRLAGGDPEGADRLVQDASEFDPEAPARFRARGKHFVQRGHAYLKEKRFSLARAEFTGALHLDEADLAAMAGLAQVLYATGGGDEAAATLRRALELPPKAEHCLGYKRLGDTALRMKQYDLAIAAYDQAMAFMKTDPILFYQQALVYTAQYQFSAALSRLNKALSLKPDFPEARVVRGKILAWQKAAEKRPAPAKEQPNPA